MHPRSISAQIANQNGNNQNVRQVHNRSIAVNRSIIQSASARNAAAASSSNKNNNIRLTPQIAQTRVLGPGAINTHFFDGKLDKLRIYVEEDLIRAGSVSKVEKMQLFLKLKSSIASSTYPERSPQTLHCLNAIIDCFEVYTRNPGANQNYDHANNLWADDLLYLVCEEIAKDDEDDEHLRLLMCQLSDMASGLCPQGRTTRLFQCLVMLKEDLSQKI